MIADYSGRGETSAPSVSSAAALEETRRPSEGVTVVGWSTTLWGNTVMLSLLKSFAYQ